MSSTPSWNGAPVTPDHLFRAVAINRATLEPMSNADWSIPAGPLKWTCRETLDHISDALGFYCGQLATLATEPRPRFRNSDTASTIPNLFIALESGANMLAAIARATPGTDRAWHRMGRADAEGFLAMACEEILIHTWDIAQGFGLTVKVPDDLATSVVSRIFPWAPTTCTPWEAQLWCSDRIELPDLGKITRWGWHSAPIAEWTGHPKPHTVFPSDT